MNIADQSMFESTFILFIERELLKSDKTNVEFGIK